MQTWLPNLLYAFRAFRESLGLTVTILLTIAPGIGANTAIFTVVYATLLAPLPYPQADQLVNVWSKVQGQRGLVSPGDFFDWKRQSTAFQDLNLGGPNNFNLATQDSPEFLDGMEATPGYYGMLGSSPVPGPQFSSRRRGAGQSRRRDPDTSALAAPRC